MKITQFLPAILSLFLIVGILIGYYLNPNSLFVVFFVVFILVVLTISHYYTNRDIKERFHFTIISFILFVWIGISAVTFQNQRNNKKHYTKFIQNENTLIIKIENQLKSNPFNDKYIAKVIQVNGHKTIGLVLVHMRRDTLLKKLVTGSVFYTKEKIQPVKKPLNPYQFNYKKYLEKQQVFHQIYTSKDKIHFMKIEKSIYSFVDIFRKKIIKSLKTYGFEKEELSIINALILGQRQDVSKELLQSYSNAGAIHILAVSGLHIGILFYILSLLFKPITYLKHGKFIQIIVIVLCLWLYAVIAGLSPSIIRAVTMFTAVSVGKFSEKRTITLQSLFISMFILLLVHPLYIFSVGFQLSYLAVFSIVYFLPLFLKMYHPKNKLLLFIWQLFAVSVSAQIAILPLSLYYFHQFPSLFFISSMVVIPILGVILGLGILVIVLALTNILPISLANFYQDVIRYLNRFIAFIGNQESFLFKDIPFSILLLLSSYVIIFSVYLLWKKATMKKLQLTLISVLILQGVLIFEKFQLEHSKEFIVFNQNRQSLFLVRNGKKSTVFSTMDSSNLHKNYALHNFMLKKGKLQIVQSQNSSIITVSNKKIVIIDSLGVYIPTLNSDYVLLQNSPKLNLDRLINSIKPKLIIADATSYKKHKVRWESTCEKYTIPFHDTSKNGAFEMKY